MRTASCSLLPSFASILELMPTMPDFVGNIVVQGVCSLNFVSTGQRTDSLDDTDRSDRSLIVSISTLSEGKGRAVRIASPEPSPAIITSMEAKATFGIRMV